MSGFFCASELRAKGAHGGVEPAEQPVDPLNANVQERARAEARTRSVRGDTETDTDSVRWRWNGAVYCERER